MVGGRVRLPADDQRRAGLVDEDVVHLVDDGVIVAALRQAIQAGGHVVAQVVEAELVIRAVGDVGVVGFAPLDGFQVLEARVVAVPVRVEAERVHRVVFAPVLDHSGRQAQEVIDRPHLLQAELRQVVVGGDEVHATPGQRVQVHRQSGGQGLAFARLHLCDLALVQHDPADELHVEVTLADGAHGSFAHDRERFRQNVVERLTVFEPLAELIRLGPQLGVAVRLGLRFEPVDFLDQIAVFVEFSFVRITEHGFCQ